LHHLNEKERESTVIQIRMSLRVPRVPELQGASFGSGRADRTRLSALGMKWGKRWRIHCGVGDNEVSAPTMQPFAIGFSALKVIDRDLFFNFSH
jgi:hypothetical protein